MFGYQDLWLLEIFVDVARSGSFGQTARNQNCSPPRVTAAIKSLEAKLGGDRLVERTNTGSTLTPKGLELLPHCQEFCAAADKQLTIFRRMSSGQAPHQLKIGTLMALYSTVIEQANAELDDLELETVVMDLTAPTPWLDDSRIDMAILLGPTTEDHRLISFPLFTEPRFAVFDPRYNVSQDGQVSFADIDSKEWPSMSGEVDQTYLAEWLCYDIRGSAPARTGVAVIDPFQMVQWLHDGDRVIVTTDALATTFASQNLLKARVVDVPGWTARLVSTIHNADEVSQVAAILSERRPPTSQPLTSPIVRT